MKRILPLVLGIFVLLVAALLIGPSFIDWNKYKPKIIEQAKKSAGYDVAIDGDIHLSLIPSPSLKLEGLRVAAPRGSEEYLLKMERADVSVKLFPLLGGDVQINTVTLVNPDIRLEKLAGGETSWMTEMPSQDDGDKSGTAQTNSGNTPAVRLDKLSIENGQVLYKDAATGSSYKVEQINMDMKADSLSGPFNADGTFVYNGQEIGLEAETSEALNAKKEVPVKIGITLPGAKAEARYNGIVALDPALEIQGSLDIQANNLASTLSALGIQAGPSLAQKLSLSGLVTANDREVSSQGLEISFGDAKGQGTLLLSNLKDQNPVKFQADMAFEGTLNLDQLNVPSKNEDAASVEERVAKGQKLSANSGVLPEKLVLPFPADGTIKVSADTIQSAGKSFKGVVLQLEKNGPSIAISGKVLDMPGKSSADVNGTLRYASYYRDGEKGFVYADPNVTWTATGSSEQLPTLLRAFVQGQDANPSFEIWKTARFDLSGSVSTKKISLIQSSVRLDETTIGLDASYRPQGANGLPDVELDLSTDMVNLDYIQSRLNGQKKPAVQKDPTQKTDVKKALAPVQSFNVPVNLTFDLSAQKAIYNTQAINGVRIKGKMAGQSLVLENASAQDYQGAAASLKGSIGNMGDLSGIDLKFYGKTGNLRALMEALQVDPSSLPAGISAAEANIKAQGAQNRLVFDASVQAMDGQLDASGTVTDIFANPPAFSNLTIGAKHPNLVKAVQLLNPGFSGGPGLEKPFEFYTQAVKDGGVYDLTNMKATLGSTYFSGALKIDTSNPKPSVTGSISASAIPLDSLLATQASGGGASSSAGGGSTANAGGDGKWSRNTIETGWMQTINLDLGLTAQSISYGGWNLLKPQTKVTLKEGSLLVDNLQAGLFGGQASLTAKVQDPADPKQPLSMVMQSKMTDVNVEPLMFALSGSNRMKAAGAVSLDMNVQASGLSPYALISSLQGKAAVNGRDVVLKGFDLSQIALAFVDTGKPMDRLNSALSGATSGGETRFDTIVGAYDISQGIVNITSMTMDGPAATIASTGNANLPLWTVNTNHVITLKQAKDAGSFNVAIKGPLSNPGNTFGKALFNDVLTRRVQQKAAEKLPDVLGDDLTGKLQGLGILPQQQKQTTPSAPVATDPSSSADPAPAEQPASNETQQNTKKDPEKALKGVLDGLLR